MTLDELMQLVPLPWRPVVAEYGPSLLKMSAEEIWAWLTLVLHGDTEGAYAAIVSKLDNHDLHDEWVKTNADWDEATADALAKKNLQQQAAIAVLRVLVTAALGLVGL